MLWFNFILSSKFNLPLFQTHYQHYYIHYHTQKQKEKKNGSEPRLKLNHNIYSCHTYNVITTNLLKPAWLFSFFYFFFVNKSCFMHISSCIYSDVY